MARMYPENTEALKDLSQTEPFRTQVPLPCSSHERGSEMNLGKHRGITSMLPSTQGSVSLEDAAVPQSPNPNLAWPFPGHSE